MNETYPSFFVRLKRTERHPLAQPMNLIALWP
jgi:hypothetical protein